MTRGSIYNTTDGPLAIDRAGRMLAARERRDDVDLEGSPIAGHVSAGRLVATPNASATARHGDGEAVEAPAETKTKRGRAASTPTQEA